MPTVLVAIESHLTIIIARTGCRILPIHNKRLLNLISLVSSLAFHFSIAIYLFKIQFAIQARCPYLQKDINMIDKFQRWNKISQGEREVTNKQQVKDKLEVFLLILLKSYIIMKI